MPDNLTHNVVKPDPLPLEDEEDEKDGDTTPAVKDEDVCVEPDRGVPDAPDVDDDDDAASYPTHSLVTVEGLLRTHRTSGNDWTHLMTWPNEVRSSITDASDAGSLYRSMSSYKCIGMGVMERRLSNITRLSVRLLLNNVMSPTEDVETELIGAIGRAMQAFVSRCLANANAGPLVAQRFCLVLRPDDVACTHPQEYIFHWPCVAVSSAEFNKAWCDELLQNMGLPTVRAVLPRNIASYYPMYGCCATPSEPRMVLRWVIGGAGDVQREWLDWFRDPRNRLHESLCIGHGTRFPKRPSPDTVFCLLPLVCSINPMGTAACLFRRETIQPVDTEDATAPQRTATELSVLVSALDRSIQALSPERITSVRLSNEVGEMIYAASCGAPWGYRMWIRWLRESRETLSVQCELELMAQWESFAHHPGGLDGLLRLKCLVRRDNTRAAWETFLQHEREADHRDRHSTNPISASMGSLTHMDLAKFVWHQLNETMQCTSTAGRGMWYVYRQRDHRWVFDKDGPTVLVECHRILRDETDKMRSQIVPRAPPATGVAHGGGGPAGGGAAPSPAPRRGMVAFPYLANFPEDEDPDMVQRALLVHLDTMMGDIRQVQSVMRALGALMCNTRFADQLDTSHEHLIPFANGVLDLDALELRPGRPEDFLMRGPTYAWIDYSADDAVVSEMEYMLTVSG